MQRELFPEGPTLAEARHDVMELARGKGGECPCCGAYTKVYRRRLNAGMARALIRLWRHDAPGTWIWISRERFATHLDVASEYSKLAYWGLLEPGDGEQRGAWRVTDKGALFVRGKVDVPSHVVLLHGRVLGWSDEVVDVRAALGARFDYGELMGRAA